MVDNIDDAYSIEDLKRMYAYLSKNGDLYYIVYDDRLVGDCAIFDHNFLAIVIDKNFRDIKIGKKVLAKLIDIGRKKELDYLQAEIYDFNQSSIALFHGQSDKYLLLKHKYLQTLPVFFLTENSLSDHFLYRCFQNRLHGIQ